ncbi:hypothetical protein DEA8626_03748 [Defluviimonas aquaemixtae]|uniref:Branched-chain amino acid aminotransferase n=1 Tax=Albidovulum aquaemixtae TaxID=1542388 RepID=A0A2R8BMY0_9RHOB|nr:hypothetical protein DEA8626_03748 [Defluviimonas aquaemixtae]
MMEVECIAQDMSPDQLRQADKVFITSIAGGAMPVTRIDGEPIWTGTPGSITKKVTERYGRMYAEGQYRIIVDHPATA